MERGAASESGCCVSFHDGVRDGDIASLRDVDEMVGQPGGLMLHTGILGHWIDSRPPWGHVEIVLLLGDIGRPITLGDIARELDRIPREAFKPHESYYWGGVLVSGVRYASVVLGS